MPFWKIFSRWRNKGPGFFIAAGLVAITLWMASGLFRSHSSEDKGHDQKLARVRVKVSRQATYPRAFTFNGYTAADQRLDLRVETGGRVEKIFFNRGDTVKQGEVILKLDPAERLAKLAQAKALKLQRRNEYRAAQTLQKKGFRSENQLDLALAQHEAAEADVVAIEKDIRDCALKAPFEGILETRTVEKGSYVARGDSVGALLSLNPLKFIAFARPQDVPFLKQGQEGELNMPSWGTFPAKLTYVASAAEDKTKSFELHFLVPNPKGALKEGVNGALTLKVGTFQAHKVPLSALVTNDQGVMGVKIVGPDKKVLFFPVQTDALVEGFAFVSGLPEEVTLIVEGQGFVVVGEHVEAETLQS